MIEVIPWISLNLRSLKVKLLIRFNFVFASTKVHICYMRIHFQSYFNDEMCYIKACRGYDDVFFVGANLA